MDKRLVTLLMGGGIIYLLHLIERRLASFENRLILGLNAQTALVREEVIYEIETDDGDEEV